MIWEVFRRSNADSPFVYCRDVHAPDRDLAKQFAVIQHGRRKPTKALWVAPQDEIIDIAPGEDVRDFEAVRTVEDESVRWEVFVPDRRGYHTHEGSVFAADGARAATAALEEYADGSDIWVVPREATGEVTDDDVSFGGTTDKSYRFAQTYNVDPAAEEVAASENEQIEAERERLRQRGDA